MDNTVRAKLASAQRKQEHRDLVETYIEVVRDFLGLDHNEALMEVFGESWVDYILPPRPRCVRGVRACVGCRHVGMQAFRMTLSD